jgi:UDP-N-acetylmuramate: L-alanyl-gamma-D-glutamyl-meso-diaminopimelate ligase
MAQVAAWIKSNGATVTGSDEGVYPPMSDFLKAQGITVRTPYRPENLEPVDTVIVGNSASRGNPEVEAVLEQRLPYQSLPELIHSQVLRHKLPIVVSGTHGKTTTTAALAQILKTADLSPGYMIGGLLIGRESGFEGGDGTWFVIEGDEYDSAFFDKRPKFLHYAPQIAIINNIEFDHADIYSSLDEIFLQFRRLIQLVPRSGCLVINADQPELAPLAEKAPCPVITFSIRNQSATVTGELIELTPEGMTFRLKLASGKQVICRTSQWGDHQLSNLISAAAAAEFAGVPADRIAAGLEAFKGVRRRMELKYSDGKHWFYEDFAHHPTAVRATLSGLKARHPGLPIIAAFEPRSNTMVRNYLQKEIAEALALADRIIIGHIHRLEKIPAAQRLDVDRILNHLRRNGKDAHHQDDVEKIIDLALENPPRESVIVAMSNGAFSGLSEKLVERMKRA